MLAPKKGLLCNLNHIHLQHISLGLHLSRHPELQETSGSMGGGEQTSCSDCPENCEQVDANSNNPSLKCQCCESHTQQLVTLGLQNQAAQEDFSCLHDGEKVASPCDPPCDLASSTSSSSSVSSCSDFSLDDSPVSVYCKGFSREESQSPENQPNISPAEDTHDGKLLADQGRTCDGRDANLNPPVPQRPDTVAGESPDSLCSGHSLDSQSDEPPPSMAAQETTSICADLDPNCNPLPDGDTEPPAPPVPGRWDPGLSRAPEPRPQAGSLPPPVPPRPRRRLQVLSGHRAEQPPLPARTAEPELSSGDLCRDVGKKTITSFHELAQKRKRNAAGPALAQARADRSDWLIVFSPDTELPPPSELLSGTTGQEPARPQLQPDWPPRPPGSRQREVTTFKELRYRSASSKPKGQPAGERAEPAAAQHPSAALEAAVGSEGSGWVPPAPLGGQLLAPADSHQLKRRRPRPGLQPIAEGQPGDAEEGGLPPRSCFPGEKGLGSGRGEDAPGRRLGGAGGDLWVPGTVERRDEACKEARPSPPAAGPAPGAAGGSTEGARRPRGEQKKALLIAVSAAVDKIIAHFSAARNLVQKAQLGDSRLSPDVGYLLLHTLCPALYALVEDGLKPFQKDVITGQRKNSPWSVVEASVKTGPNTRSLHSLCWHVAGLAPLSSTRQKFHAFILGLLNIKQLELWISQLQKSPGVISVLYSPTAFFALSQGPFPHLADELLLLIQPLSVLTFHLDLLFEHHHLSMDVRPLSRRLESPLSPARHSAQAQGAVQPARGGQSGAGGTSLEEEMPPDALGRAASAEGSTRSQAQAAARGLVPAPQVGVALQQTLQHVLRWGDQLSRAFLGADGSPETPRSEAGPRDAGAGLSGWWGQLSQASRIYAAPSKEKVPFIWWTKLRTAAGESSPGLAARSQTSMNEPRGTELQLLQTKGVPELPSPKATSSADTSGTSSPEDLVLSAGAGAPTNDPIAGEKLLPVSPEPRANGDRAAPSDPEAGGPPGPDKGSWLGRLFGATSPSARSFPPNPDTTSAKSRRPSSWLSPSARVLAAVVKGLASEKTRVPEPERNVSASPQSHRAVRALCDHLGTADGHLSFQKGDILQLLSTVDEDWIRCCHGNSTGLVPVGYTSLIL